jgi:hypothetical protein
MKRFIVSMMIVMILSGMWPSQAVNSQPATPVPAAVVDAKRIKILEYLTDLSNGNVISFKGAISGQNCSHGSEITDSDWYQGYKNMVAALQTATGKGVGMIGADYEFSKCFTPAQLRQKTDDGLRTEIRRVWEERIFHLKISQRIDN